jgi:cellobiose phosphorylase
MQYGYFDDANREYVITNPRTPVKWINYVGTLAFGGFVDHTGGSLICKGDPSVNRIVKYIPQMPDSDFKGETLYIRLKENGGYRVFSPYYVPTLDPYDRYECHVGLGYTRIVSEFYGIRTEVTVFVPAGARRVVRDIRVTNLREEPVDLDLIPVVEYTHFEALKQFNNNDWVPQTMQSWCVEQEQGLKVLFQCAFMKRGTAMNYLTSNHHVSSFESDRRNFLGDNGYGTWRQPKSLLQDELSNYEALRGDNIGALLHHMGVIAPGGTARLITQLGQCADLADDMEEITYYRDPANVDKAFADLASFWDAYLAKMQVRTPDESFNTMVNIHNPRQCYITKYWSRYLSLYQLGLGTRGIGFRDSSQDVMGVLSHMPDEGRELIEMLLQVQRWNGCAMHSLNPATMEGSVGDSAEMEDRPDYYGDDHLWIVLAVCAYIKETADTGFLGKEIPFYEKDKHGKPLESGTVMDHLMRAIEFTHKNTGAHGLPLLGFADWNDTVNLPTGAESVFIANLYGVALRDMIGLCEYLGETALADTYRGYYEEIRDVLNRECWDGEWYVRYFDEAGNVLGSRTNTEGQIYTNAQSWSVLSGLATAERAEKALASVNRILNTRKGIKLSYPGYKRYDPHKGGVSTYPPGAKENGGIFLHANPWVMIAETMLGHGDRAYQYYNQINPAAKNDTIDEYESEPYVYCQNILGDEHPQFGLGRNSWLSGTASWTYQAATQYILGIRPDYAGLKVDPCIPSGWDGFSVTRQYRGEVYRIQVRNPRHVCKGVKKITVDGKEIDGNVLPVFGDGKEHEVEVEMG